MIPYILYIDPTCGIDVIFGYNVYDGEGLSPRHDGLFCIYYAHIRLAQVTTWRAYFDTNKDFATPSCGHTIEFH